ncbi:hypothetical protein BT69DRAFT_679668 [Atractiella rhizophila]|nr:hypothetical protein BT69DRAFT_679668 [Atractiella rhizophila]
MLSPHFPECLFKLSKLHAGWTMQDEGDGIYKLLHNSGLLQVFRIAVGSHRRLRQLLYLYCGGRNNSNPTFVDAFRLLNSKVTILHISTVGGFRAEANLDAGKLRLYGDEEAREIAVELNSAIMEGSLPALRLVRLKGGFESQAMETLKRLAEEHQFKVEIV